MIAQQLRGLERDGRPQEADAVVRKLGAKSGLPRADIDRLAAYVATAYLAEMRDKAALSLPRKSSRDTRSARPNAIGRRVWPPIGWDSSKTQPNISKP